MGKERSPLRREGMGRATIQRRLEVACWGMETDVTVAPREVNFEIADQQTEVTFGSVIGSLKPSSRMPILTPLRGWSLI